MTINLFDEMFGDPSTLNIKPLIWALAKYNLSIASDFFFLTKWIYIKQIQISKIQRNSDAK